MNVIGNVKLKAQVLRKETTALYYACRHPEVGLLPRILIFVTIAYALSPIDLIPDFIPVLGYLDDLVIIPLLIALSIRLVPAYVMREARERAEREPVTLRNNRFAAAIIILIWGAILASIIIAIMRSFWRLPPHG